MTTQTPKTFSLLLLSPDGVLGADWSSLEWSGVGVGVEDRELETCSHSHLIVSSLHPYSSFIIVMLLFSEKYKKTRPRARNENENENGKEILSFVSNEK